LIFRVACALTLVFGMKSIACAQNQPPPPGPPPTLIKVKDDLYVLQNQANTIGDLIAYGGNATILLTDAGVLLIDGQPSMWLVHPEQEAAAKAALLTDPSFGNFDFRRAQVLQARWDFAQLVDWYNYLMTTGIWTNSGLVSGDKDERINRIRYGVKDEASQQELVRRLEALDVPCNLIQVGLESPPVTL